MIAAAIADFVVVDMFANFATGWPVYFMAGAWSASVALSAFSAAGSMLMVLPFSFYPSLKS